MAHVPIRCELWIDGIRVADDSIGHATTPAALDELTIRWGRQTTIDQPQPATCSGSILDSGTGPTRVEDIVALGSSLVAWAVLDADRRIVFAGRVTDVQTAWDDALDGAVTQVVAADLLADLASRYVGAEPWPAESLSARAARILAAVGVGSITVDPRPAALTVSRMDVDRQAAAGLLGELATTGTAVLWVAVAPGSSDPALWIEDPATRESLWMLGQGGDGLWRPVPSPGAGDLIDSGALLREPVAWDRATADLVTRVTVRWLDQTTTPDPTERSVSIIDPASETRWGARGLSVGTLLTSADAATRAAQQWIVAHQNHDAWRAAGLVWDTARTVTDDAAARALLLNLLDNRQRPGRVVQVSGLPWWTPAAGSAGRYIEGGSYRFTGGRWVLDLATTSTAGFGASVTYQQTPRQARYQDIAPDVSYLDLLGVGPPATAELDASPRGGTNAYGFPVPDQTDPFCDVPAALAALAAAVEPKLQSKAIQFMDLAQRPSDANGLVPFDLRDRWLAIGGSIVNAEAGPPWAGNMTQMVDFPTNLPGTFHERMFQVPPPLNTVAPNGAPLLSAIVWGTPK